MEKLKLKREYLLQALARLYEAVEDGEKEKNKSVEDEREWGKARDSMIKRFEFTMELFWKYVKKYLENVEGTMTGGPRRVIREACSIGLINTEDAEALLNMIDDRNQTSHIYKEDIANRISSKIPAHYKIMRKYADKLVPSL